MDRDDMVLGSIALVVGVLLGLLFAPRGASLEEIEAAIDERLLAIEGAASGTGDSITSLQTQIEERLTSLGAQVEALQSDLNLLGGQLAAMESAASDGAPAPAEPTPQPATETPQTAPEAAGEEEQ